MKALVTGAAGFVGSHLVEQLLADGAGVVGIDCFTDYYARELKEANLETARSHDRFAFIESRLQDADLDLLLRDTTHVFHLAAQAGVRKSWGLDFSVYTACNIEATQVLLEACARTELSKFVYASSSSVYGDDGEMPMHEGHRPQPLSPYGVTKLAAEHLCYLYWVAHKAPTVSLRYFTVYGPRQRPDMAFNRFLRAMVGEEPITLYGDGEQTRDFTFVRDAVAATIAAANRGEPGSVYNIGGGARVSVNQVLDLMAACTGMQPRIQRSPAQKGDMRDTYADTTAARESLGFRPIVPLEAGIEEEYRWISNAVTHV
ncbi:MAG: GDP-mannose 4,6-dehydratase [Vicinamibacterales bacterium]|jgi:UDP-glucose 4-epimerase|nr:GDP-mannose 4,6-dehydratase [Vicinamibacterales bacterium]HJN44594.1 GDP-mannose 4,6-dehydratase [Vicinamibacterales bacterium]